MKSALESLLGPKNTKMDCLKELALSIINERREQNPNDPVRLDRAAVRSKDCLICWFCENCPEFLHPSNLAPRKALADPEVARLAHMPNHDSDTEWTNRDDEFW
jgi:hypothetical protein